MNSEAITTADTRLTYTPVNKSTPMSDTTAVNAPTSTSARINSSINMLKIPPPYTPTILSHPGSGCEHFLDICTYIILLIIFVLFH